MYSQDHIFCPYRSECEVPKSSEQGLYQSLPDCCTSAIDGSQITVGSDGKKLEPERNVLLASIENMQYAVTLDVLHMVFFCFWTSTKDWMFDKNGGVRALIQYPDVQTAIVAKDALEGHYIYDGGFCKLHISYSRHTDLSIKVNNDRSRDYTLCNILGQLPSAMIGATAQQHVGCNICPVLANQWHIKPRLYGAQLRCISQNEAPNSMPPYGHPGAVPQFMPIQVPNSMPPYDQPGAVPYEMGPGMIQAPNQNGLPNPGAVNPYRLDRPQ